MIDTPNWTQCPNQILELIPALKEGELKVVLVIVRETCGYHRATSKLNNPYLEKATGLSPQGVRNAVKGLLTKELIVMTRYHDGTEYGLNVESAYVSGGKILDPKISSQKPENPHEESDLGSRPGGGKNLDPQIFALQQKGSSPQGFERLSAVFNSCDNPYILLYIYKYITRDLDLGSLDQEKEFLNINGLSQKKEFDTTEEKELKPDLDEVEQDKDSAAESEPTKKTKSKRSKKPVATSRHYPEVCRDLWEVWRPFFDLTRNSRDSLQGFVEGFDWLVEQGIPVRDIEEGLRYYVENKTAELNQRGQVIAPPDGIRFFKGKTGHPSSYCLDALSMKREREQDGLPPVAQVAQPIHRSSTALAMDRYVEKYRKRQQEAELNG